MHLWLGGRCSDQLGLGSGGLHVGFHESTALVGQTVLVCDLARFQHACALVPRRQLDSASLLVFCGHAVVFCVTIVSVEARLLLSLGLELAIGWLALLNLLRAILCSVHRTVGALGGSWNEFCFVGAATHHTDFFFSARSHDWDIAVWARLLEHSPALQEKCAHLGSGTFLPLLAFLR